MHRAYTVAVFVILASLDNVAIGLVPPLYDPIGAALDVPEGAVAAVTAATAPSGTPNASPIGS